MGISRVWPILLLLCGVFRFVAAAESEWRPVLLKPWLVCGPFAADVTPGDYDRFLRCTLEKLPCRDHLGNAAQVRPVAGAPLDASADLTWREVNSPTVDFAGLFTRDSGVAYAACYFEQPEQSLLAMQTTGLLGRVWVNGKLVYDGHTLTAGDWTVAYLLTGRNLILVRVDGLGHDPWGRDLPWRLAPLAFVSASERTIVDFHRGCLHMPAVGGRQPGTIHYVEGFHCDAVYLLSQADYAQVNLSLAEQFLTRLRDDPHAGAFLSELDYLRPFLDSRPEWRERVLAWAKEGRIGTGGSYNQFNAMSICGESILRNLYYGKVFHNDWLGSADRTLCLWDSFGHTAQSSQIVANSGLRGMVWSKTIPGFPPYFFHVSPDGTQALHRRTDYAFSFSGYGSGKHYSPGWLRRMCESKFEELRSLGSCCDLRLNAADFTPPAVLLHGKSGQLRDASPDIVSHGSGQDRYLQTLSAEIAAGKARRFVTSRDAMFFHTGVAAARSDLKVVNRLAENRLLAAEKFATFAAQLGMPYADAEFDLAWRQLLFVHHHDGITGSDGDTAHLDLLLSLREALAIADSELSSALHYISRHVSPPLFRPAGTFDRILVFNPLNWERSETVEMELRTDRRDVEVTDEEGRKMPTRLYVENGRNRLTFWAPNVPSLGYRLFYLVCAQALPSVDKRKEYVLENRFHRIVLDPAKGGAIVSWLYKPTGEQVVNTESGRLGNEIVRLREDLTKVNYPAWEFYTTGARAFSSSLPAEVSIESDALGMQATVRGQIPAPDAQGKPIAFCQELRLDSDSPRLDIRVDFPDYRDQDEILAVLLPTRQKNSVPVFEDRFTAVVRKGSKGFLDFRSRAEHLLSGAFVYPTYQWADLSHSARLVARADDNTEAGSVPIGMVQLVYPSPACEPGIYALVTAMAKAGLSVTPLPVDLDMPRRQHLAFSDDTRPRCWLDNRAYTSFQIFCEVIQGGQPLSDKGKTLWGELSAERRATALARLGLGQSARLFVYEPSLGDGWEKLPTLLVAAADEAGLQREIAALREEFVRSGQLSLAASLWQGELPKPDRTSVAVINQGTPAISLEAGNVWCLILSHTAPWPARTLDFEFVPEYKRHRYDYSFLPHQGDWRQGRVVHEAYNRNHPLVAVTPGMARWKLPASASFLKVSSDQVIITAVKPTGSPYAELRGNMPDARTLSLRCYEAHGTDASVGLSFLLLPRTCYSADLMEQRGTAVDITKLALPAFGIAGFELEPCQPLKTARPEYETPLVSRYWQHNLGAAPLGNDPLKITLRPVAMQQGLSSFAYQNRVKQGGHAVLQFELAVVNNLVDRAIDGEVELQGPHDWVIVPEKIAYRLAPKASQVYPFSVAGFRVEEGLAWERASGYLVARTCYDGDQHKHSIFDISASYEDVLAVGAPKPLVVSHAEKEGAVWLTLANANRQDVQGEIFVVTPPEAWPLDFAVLPGGDRRPYRYPFAVPAGGSIRQKIADLDTLPHGWLVAKVAAYGQVVYHKIR